MPQTDVMTLDMSVGREEQMLEHESDLVEVKVVQHHRPQVIEVNANGCIIRSVIQWHHTRIHRLDQWGAAEKSQEVCEAEAVGTAGE